MKYIHLAAEIEFWRYCCKAYGATDEELDAYLAEAKDLAISSAAPSWDVILDRMQAAIEHLERGGTFAPRF